MQIWSLAALSTVLLTTLVAAAPNQPTKKQERSTANRRATGPAQNGSRSYEPAQLPPPPIDVPIRTPEREQVPPPAGGDPMKPFSR